MSPLKLRDGHLIDEEKGICWGKKNPYKPCVGDRVSLEGEVTELVDDACLKVEIYGEMFGSTGWKRLLVSRDSLKLLSRSPRKVTRAEVEKLLGGEFELVD